MKTLRPTVAAARATELGYRPLTTGYDSSEEWMLENAIASLESGQRAYVLVQNHPQSSIEIWSGAITPRLVGSERDYGHPWSPKAETVADLQGRNHCTALP